jgi:BirA family biotin operon repressor/biotin-[acetyl-CoA-carboxylase] ligase
MIPASGPAPADVLAAVHAASARAVSMRLDLRWFASVTSTMDVAEELAQGGAAEGMVIAADEQTRGRGRRGHTWSSPPGAGLYLTFVLQPPVGIALSVLPLLTLAAGVAARRAVAGATGLSPELKWPNDLLVGRRKLAGILCEGLAIGTAAQTVLVGIGINLRRAAHPEEIADRATSLEEELGRAVDRGHLFEEILVTMPTAYDNLRRGNADDILRAWREASPSAVGHRVEWEEGHTRRRGTTAGIDATGALLVDTAAGTERIHAGALTWK